MNKKGQKSVLGFALLIAAFLFILVVLATIEPQKEALDDARDTSSLNCQGTTNFNQTAFNNDNNNTIARLTRRPTCFVTGLSMVWFVGAFIIAVFVWVVKNWRKFS